MVHTLIYLYITLIVFQMTLPLSGYTMWRFLCGAVCFIVIMIDVHVLIHNGDNGLLLLLAVVQILASVGVGIAYKQYAARGNLTTCITICFILSVIALPLSISFVR